MKVELNDKLKAYMNENGHKDILVYLRVQRT